MVGEQYLPIQNKKVEKCYQNLVENFKKVAKSSIIEFSIQDNTSSFRKAGIYYR